MWVLSGYDLTLMSLAGKGRGEWKATVANRLVSDGHRRVVNVIQGMAHGLDGGKIAVQLTLEDCKQIFELADDLKKRGY